MRSSSRDQVANLHVVTHLASARVDALLAQGVAPAAAIAQAEQELRAALDIGAPGTGLGTDMALLGAGADPWVFAASAVILQAAEMGDHTLEVNLTALLGGIEADLAGDGQIDPSWRATLDAAEGALDPEVPVRHMREYLDDHGASDVVLPDIHAGLDSDFDGHANASDTCPYAADPGQEDADSDGIGDACEYQFRRLTALGDYLTGVQEDGRIYRYRQWANPPQAASHWTHALPPNLPMTTDAVLDAIEPCVITLDGDLRCYTWSEGAWLSEPYLEVADDFVSVEASYWAACGLRADGEAACWHRGGDPLVVPDATFAEIEVQGLPDDTTALCGAVLPGGVLGCWNLGTGDAILEGVLPEAPVREVSLEYDYTSASVRGCAVRLADDTLACWGGTLDPTPTGAFRDVTVYGNVACALPASGGATCWRLATTGPFDDRVFASTPPDVVLSDIVLGHLFACALDDRAVMRCW